jgi:3alpha(or 20beta)-hydroxysteroid dehydrogenase
VTLLEGKIAIITGAARGLGAATAGIFVREGASVVLTDVLDAEGKETAAHLGDAASYAGLDVTSEHAWQHLVADVLEQHGQIDVLVNNAGVQGVYPLADSPPSRYDQIVAIIQTGTYLGMRAVLPHMVLAGRGAVVNIGSTQAVDGLAHASAYTAAKHGVVGMSKALALEVAPSGVRVMAVCPGAMRTPMLSEAFGEQMEAFAGGIPMGRLSDPAEVGEVVAFAASDRASYCTGAVWMADGGLTAG